MIDSTGAPMPVKPARFVPDYGTAPNVLEGRDPTQLPKYKKASAAEHSVWIYLAAQKIGVSIIASGATMRGDWECDSWAVTFHKLSRENPAGPYASERFEYFTGTGHRVEKSSMIFSKPKGASVNSIAYRNWARTGLVATVPHFASVLHSLILDSHADDMSFNNWCEEFGYDTDSRKALDTYTACCDTAKKMRSIFTRSQIAHVETILQDY